MVLQKETFQNPVRVKCKERKIPNCFSTRPIRELTARKPMCRFDTQPTALKKPVPICDDCALIPFPPSHPNFSSQPESHPSAVSYQKASRLQHAKKKNTNFPPSLVSPYLECCTPRSRQPKHLVIVEMGH